ncbi:DUF3325 family protein [Limnobacter sp. 130]|jgi:hypothetical protein|uniref:DUF3325 family protein n=1 Tax=Limnobacter sp. 130 TaxID=2653147 RepID=UPI0012F18F86|nr:DUF3325 family protein [Limnobacter sp. 130]VWX33533.1 conserved membrane hypothetical protein [Limnobacter sp. 130]
MPEALYLTAAALLSMVGMAWLALSMDVHWAQVKQIPLAESRPPRVALKVLGYTALLVSLVVCLVADRPSIAALVWIMLMVGAAVAVAFALANRPGVLKVVCPLNQKI